MHSHGALTLELLLVGVIALLGVQGVLELAQESSLVLGEAHSADNLGEDDTRGDEGLAVLHT